MSSRKKMKKYFFSIKYFNEDYCIASKTYLFLFVMKDEVSASKRTEDKKTVCISFRQEVVVFSYACVPHSEIC